MLAIGLGLLAVLLVVYAQLTFKVFDMTYESTRDDELALLAKLRANEQENVELIRDIQTTLDDPDTIAEQKAEYREMIGHLEEWLVENRVAMRRQTHWRRRHLWYVLRRGVWVYIGTKIKKIF